MFFGRSAPAHEGLNLRQIIVVILMNVFLLAELAFSIYLGHRDQENMAAIFLAYFIPMVIATLVLTRLLIRRGRKVEVGSGNAEGKFPS